jgi:DNA-binding PadR family transcriptional regulator
MTLPSTPEPPLTVTQYAILGLAGQRPATTYELSRAMATSFDYFWPRARSLVYAEVKRLAGRGYLDAVVDYVGRRRRTTYTITEAGRAAVGDWLRTPPRSFALEMEALLRVYLAPYGARDDLLAALRSAHESAVAMLGIAAGFRRAYLEGSAPAMDEIATRAILNDFLANFADLVRSWSERSLATVEPWPDLAQSTDRADAALATFAALPPRADEA